MKLHEFIATTLGDIQPGVQTAIDNAIEKGMRGAINPVWGTVEDANRSHVQNVQFDIAVTVSERAMATVSGENAESPDFVQSI